MVSFDEQKEFWEAVKKRRAPDHPVIQAFARPKLDFILAKLTLPDSPRPSMLEVGCGNGYFSYTFDRAFNLTCLDFSRNMLEMHPLPWSRKVVGRAEDLQFDDDSFDIVFSGNLLHHIEHPLVAVREMKRVARRNVVLIEPNTANPLMFLFNLLKREERGALKFTAGYVRSLGVGSGLRLRAQCAQGAIVPNKTPKAMLPFVRLIDRQSPLGFYHT
jgi:SAM-dependent methyltransferase